MRRLVFGALLILAPALAAAKEPERLIDYDGFTRLAAEVQPYREARRIGLDRFSAMAAEPDALILDARSRAAFARGHIRGAVNLPFSDFNAASLAAVIGDPKRRVLIYCNNNFTDDVSPVILKSAPLALNIPTFINLYGYGYKNIYELADAVSIKDARLNWERS